MTKQLLLCLLLLFIVTPAIAQTIEDGGKLYDVVPTSGRQELTPATDTRKAIVLVHGWNPTATPFDSQHPDGAYNGEFASLVSNIRGRLRQADNRGWKLIPYHWERDAATGPSNWAVIYPYPAAVNGTEAAQNGYQHGFPLAEQLHSSAPNLEKVHFIAHSAGTWVVERAVRRLRALKPTIEIQVTLLDPFIPDELWAFIIIPQNMGVDEIEQLSALSNITLLENYYAIGKELGTQEVFSNWPAPPHINRRIDWVETTYSPTAGQRPLLLRHTTTHTVDLYPSIQILCARNLVAALAHI